MKSFSSQKISYLSLHFNTIQQPELASETVGEGSYLWWKMQSHICGTAPGLGRFQVLLTSHIITYPAAQTVGQNKAWPLIRCMCSFVYVALLIIKSCQISLWQVSTVYIYKAPEHGGCWYFMHTCLCSFPGLALTWNRKTFLLPYHIIFYFICFLMCQNVFIHLDNIC